MPDPKDPIRGGDPADRLLGGPDPRPRPRSPHPAGPHARPDLTNEDATPGAGTLSSPTEDDEADASSS